VRLTHPDRVLWPEQGITKRALATYLVTVADRLLPETAGRPLTLLRCPQGPERKCFVQRHPGEGAPPQLRTVEIDEDDGKATYVTADDPPALVALAQLGVLELHPWPARAADPERPDRLILDLDPGEGVGFPAVVEAALRLRELLAELGLASVPRTTGGRGLHVVAPLLPGHGWDAHLAAARALAERLAAAAPERYTTAIPKAERRGRIFVDYLRNGRGASAIACCSPRARPGAPVAMPLAWEELTPGLDPAAFTLRTVPERLDSRPDPWAGTLALRQKLPPGL
jgi:bifunctional non-homologous end joining protein LigD